MSDLGKVVQKLSETNLRLGRLEEQNAESNTAASIIAQSLPEVLNDRNVASNREKFDKDQRITETDDNVRDNTKTLAAKIDTTNLILKDKPKDIDPNFIGPMPLKKEPELKPKPTPTGSDEEDENDRTKALKKVFSPLTKSFDKVSKSITGFIGGMAKTVTGGAALFLKGIITASVLGLIIKFLQSDYFKDFLSEENLNKLSDFFTNIGTYFDNLFKFIANETDPNSIAYAIAAGAGIFLAGGLIGMIISGIKGTYYFLKSLGFIFGIDSLFGKKATAAASKDIDKLKKGGGLKNLMRFVKGAGIIALIAGVATAFFGFLTGAIDSYMKGNSFISILVDGLAGILKAFGFTDAAKKLKEKLDPSDETITANMEKKLAKLRELQDFGDDNQKEIDALEKKLGIQKELTKTNIVEKKFKKDIREEQEDFMKKNQQKRLKVADDYIAGLINVDQMNAKIAEIDKESQATLFLSPKNLKNRNLQIEALKLEDINEKIQNIKNRDAKDLSSLTKAVENSGGRLAIGVSQGGRNILVPANKMSGIDGGMTTTIINSTTDNSKSENKTIMAKPVRNQSIPEQYLYSGY